MARRSFRPRMGRRSAGSIFRSVDARSSATTAGPKQALNTRTPGRLRSEATAATAPKEGRQVCQYRVYNCIQNKVNV